LLIDLPVFVAKYDGQAKWAKRHIEADRQIRRLFRSGIVASEQRDQRIVKRLEVQGLASSGIDRSSHRS
jgi:hypothetical protein